MSEEDSVSPKYGNLKGSGLQTPDPETISKNSSAPSTSSLQPSEKVQLMTICSHNRITPEFRKLSSIPGSYKVLVSVYIPMVGSDEVKHFEETSTGSTKKEAENQASQTVLSKVKEFYDDYNPPDLTNIKQTLISLVKANRKRFSEPEFEPDLIKGSSIFRYNVLVKDMMLHGKTYSTVGQGIGKRDAEKDAAYRMVRLLEEELETSPPTTENKVELLQMRFESDLPDHKLRYHVPYTDDDESENLFCHCKLQVLRDEQPLLTIAFATGCDEETAKQSCAEIFLIHFDKIKEKLNKM